MAKNEIVEGEIVSRNSYKKSKRTKKRSIEINGIAAILILILAICLVALILKFAIGLLAGLLQVIIIVAAIGLVGVLIYNWIRGKK